MSLAIGGAWHEILGRLEQDGLIREVEPRRPPLHRARYDVDRAARDSVLAEIDRAARHDPADAATECLILVLVPANLRKQGVPDKLIRKSVRSRIRADADPAIVGDSAAAIVHGFRPHGPVRDPGPALTTPKSATRVRQTICFPSCFFRGTPDGLHRLRSTL